MTIKDTLEDEMAENGESLEDVARAFVRDKESDEQWQEIHRRKLPERELTQTLELQVYSRDHIYLRQKVGSDMTMFSCYREARARAIMSNSL